MDGIGKLSIHLISKESSRGLKPPATGFFIALYYNLPVFTQGERGAQKNQKAELLN